MLCFSISIFGLMTAMMDEEIEKTALDLALIKCLRIFARHGRKLRLKGYVSREKKKVAISDKLDVKSVSVVTKENE